MNDKNKALFLEHARLQLPKEACAVLTIQRGVETLNICRNIAEDSLNNFIIDPEDFARAQELGDVIAIIHSHPMNSPLPSQADKVSCEQTKLKWYIVGGISGDWFELEPSNYKAPLVGRSFTHGILDCYSIIKDYFSEVLSISIPDFDRDFEWWKKGDDLYAQSFPEAGFVEVDISDIRKHDVILMQIHSVVINHGAVYLGDEKILHQLQGRLSSVDVYGGYWQKHTVKVVRHKDLL